MSDVGTKSELDRSLLRKVDEDRVQAFSTEYGEHCRAARELKNELSFGTSSRLWPGGRMMQWGIRRP